MFDNDLVVDPFGQHGFDIRFAWGPVGAHATRADVGVVVDVLSFSTSVTIAVERGMHVYPYRWRGRGAQAEAFAAEHDAVLAVGRREASRRGGVVPPSLSPAGLLSCPPVPRLVLPSPNGSTITTALGLAGGRVVVGCLRNADAVATWLGTVLDAGQSVAVIAAGERWGSDGSLRVAVEDHLGSGAILSHLVRTSHGDRLSPEARLAADLFEATRPTLGERLRECIGGLELASRGFSADVDVAAELSVSETVPVLVDGAFEAAAR